MRFVESEKVRQLGKEIEPYIILSKDGVRFKEGTPDEIKEKYELWSKLYYEEFKAAQEMW